MRNIVFEVTAFEQFNQWATEDRKIYNKIVQLINDIQRHPFEGIGKPEPLSLADAVILYYFVFLQRKLILNN